MKKKLVNSSQIKLSKNIIGFVSLGCPKALVDTEKLINTITRYGYQIANSYELADLVVVNTCGFIESAVEESFQAIAEALSVSNSVMVCGCLGVKADEIINKFPQLKAIVGANHDQIISAILKLLPPSKQLPKREFLNANGGIKLTPPQYAYIKIAEGCNHKCSFCVIPKLRGKLISRSLKEIVSEAELLAQNGCQEIILIAQDLLAYGSDFKNGKNFQNLFLKLIDKLAEIGIWIRLHYLYPYPLVDHLIEKMAENKILPYLDIPLQHVSFRLLRSMKRPAFSYKQNMVDNHSQVLINQINHWRKKLPELTIRSSFIVGYPNEQESDFEELLSFLVEAQLDRVGCFTYSPISGAKANNIIEQIPEQIKIERQKRLMKVQEKISRSKLKKRVGKIYEVIVQNIITNQKHKYIQARSYSESPNIDGDILIPLNNLNINLKNINKGDHFQVRITNSSTHDLEAEIIRELPRFNPNAQISKPSRISSISVVTA